jgi:predicted dehydrogenase
MTDPIGIGVVGLGFMGRTHIGAYTSARTAGVANQLVAVADARVARLSGEDAVEGNLGDTAVERLFDPQATRGYERPEDLFADEAVQLVSICTPTDTHVDLALAALEAGKHVLVEKPVALEPADVERLCDGARAASTLCMPAMCMRFWPGWSWLKLRIDEGTFGAVTSASFRRLGSRPAWSPFYADASRSGGALFDLHVHDTDFVHWCFGPPESVVSSGSIDHITTRYVYANGPSDVTAEGGWNRPPEAPFVMTYDVVFEGARARFELGAAPQLSIERNGTIEPVPLEDADGWTLEVRHLLEAVRDGRSELDATVEDALEVTRTLASERAAVRGA